MTATETTLQYTNNWCAFPHGRIRRVQHNVAIVPARHRNKLYTVIERVHHWCAGVECCAVWKRFRKSCPQTVCEWCGHASSITRAGQTARGRYIFFKVKHLQVEVEQLRVVDKGFTPENPVSIFEICGGDLCGSDVGKRGCGGYRDGLYGAVGGCERLRAWLGYAVCSACGGTPCVC